MAFNKRRKQPYLFRDPSVDPTKQVAALLAGDPVTEALPAIVVNAKPRKAARKRAKTTKH